MRHAAIDFASMSKIISSQNTIGAVNVVNDILLEALKQESLIVGSIDSET